MGKVIDITSKLSFEENPKLKIKDVELEVNSDAKTVLEIMGIYGDGDVSYEDIFKMKDLLFANDGVEKLDKMKLSFDDYVTVIKIAMNLATGDEDEEEDEGKQQIPDTTS